jgi:excinuclease ABC subunit B
MYADTVTDSMRRALGETERRRRKQISYNEVHGITPVGVSKRIKDMIEGIYQPDLAREALVAAERLESYGAMSEKDLLKELKRAEREMLEAAKNLEFERAARLRDELKQLKELAFGVTESDLPATAGRDSSEIATVPASRKRRASRGA